MKDITVEGVRRTLQTLADQARPVELGEAALAGAERRRRRALVGGAAAVLLLITVVAVPLGLSSVRRGAAPPAAGQPTTGPRVVTSYVVGGRSFVIDPTTGRYRQAPGGVAAVSPNLDRYANVVTVNDRSTLRIMSTSGDPAPRTLDLAGWAGQPAWSPDGNWLALPIWEVPADELTAHGFHDIYLVDTINLTARRQTLELGAGPGESLRWDETDRLLVTTPGRLSTVRTDGTLVASRALPPGLPCTRQATAMLPAPLFNGRLLLCKLDGSTASLFTVVPSGADEQGSDIGSFTVTDEQRLTPVAWAGGDTVVLSVEASGRNSVNVVRLGYPALGPPAGRLPRGAGQILVGSTDGLAGTATAVVTF